jgi:hypothetical protein
MYCALEQPSREARKEPIKEKDFLKRCNEFQNHSGLSYASFWVKQQGCFNWEIYSKGF